MFLAGHTNHIKFMPAKIETTHSLIDRKLVVFRRPDSEVWQCRYTVDGKRWHCKTTGERELV